MLNVVRKTLFTSVSILAKGKIKDEEFQPGWKCVKRGLTVASFMDGVPHEKAAPDAWINTRGLDRRIRT
jgi:hypothetical protein